MAQNAQYIVYRTENPNFSSPSDFTRLTPNPITATKWVDSAAGSGTKIYQVRVLSKIVTGSGSFLDLGQGTFYTLQQ